MQEKRLRQILGTSYNDLGAAEARQQKYLQALIHFHEAERWSAFYARPDAKYRTGGRQGWR